MFGSNFTIYILIFVYDKLCLSSRKLNIGNKSKKNYVDISNVFFLDVEAHGLQFLKITYHSQIISRTDSGLVWHSNYNPPKKHELLFFL